MVVKPEVYIVVAEDQHSAWRWALDRSVVIDRKRFAIAKVNDAAVILMFLSGQALAEQRCLGKSFWLQSAGADDANQEITLRPIRNVHAHKINVLKTLRAQSIKWNLVLLEWSVVKFRSRNSVNRLTINGYLAGLSSKIRTYIQ